MIFSVPNKRFVFLFIFHVVEEAHLKNLREYLLLLSLYLPKCRVSQRRPALINSLLQAVDDRDMIAVTAAKLHRHGPAFETGLSTRRNEAPAHYITDYTTPKQKI